MLVFAMTPRHVNSRWQQCLINTDLRWKPIVKSNLCQWRFSVIQVMVVGSVEVTEVTTSTLSTKIQLSAGKRTERETDIWHYCRFNTLVPDRYFITFIQVLTNFWLSHLTKAPNLTVGGWADISRISDNESYRLTSCCSHVHMFKMETHSRHLHSLLWTWHRLLQLGTFRWWRWRWNIPREPLARSDNKAWDQSISALSNQFNLKHSCRKWRTSSGNFYSCCLCTVVVGCGFITWFDNRKSIL